MLSPDEVECVLNHVDDIATLLQCLLVNKTWSIMARLHLNALPFAQLLQKDSCLQEELLKYMCITPRLANTLDHRKKRRFGGGVYKIFPLPSTVLTVLEEHDGLQGLAMRQSKRATRSRNATATRQKKIKSREAALRESLARVGCEVESKLGEHFIRYGHGRTADSVARSIAFNRWLDEYTNYNDALQSTVEELQHEFGYFSGIWKYGAWLTRQDYAPPATWPWLQF